MEKKMMGLIKLLGTIVCCYGVYYIYSHRKQLKKIINRSRDNDVLPKDADEEVFNTFLPHANDFDGLYEPLYKGAKGLRNKERMLNTLNEWSVRMRNLCRTSPELKNWWDAVTADMNSLDAASLQIRMNIVLELLQKGGIVRDTRVAFVADEDSPIYYMEVDNKTWRIGDKLTVDSPCWYLPTTPPRIIEKGYCILNNK